VSRLSTGVVEALELAGESTCDPAIVTIDQAKSTWLGLAIDRWRRASSCCRAAESNPFGWFSFRDAELEREFLSHRLALWTPRLKLAAGLGLLIYVMLSVAAIADWAGFLMVSSGKPQSAHDAAHTYVPTACLALLNIVLRSRLWTARSFELLVSCTLLTAMLIFALPAIIELRGQQAGPGPLGDTDERLDLLGIGTTCRLGCSHESAVGCIEDDAATTFIACSKLMPDATLNTLNLYREAGVHFAVVSAMCVSISLMPCAPFAPLGSFALQLVALALFFLRHRVMTLRYYGLAVPIPWFMYAVIVCPATFGTLVHWRAERNQFLVHCLTQRRAEQLSSEKERLDYERRFALQKSARNDKEHRRPRSESSQKSARNDIEHRRPRSESSASNSELVDVMTSVCDSRVPHSFRPVSPTCAPKPPVALGISTPDARADLDDFGLSSLRRELAARRGELGKSAAAAARTAAALQAADPAEAARAAGAPSAGADEVGLFLHHELAARSRSEACRSNAEPSLIHAPARLVSTIPDAPPMRLPTFPVGVGHQLAPGEMLGEGRKRTREVVAEPASACTSEPAAPSTVTSVCSGTSEKRGFASSVATSATAGELGEAFARTPRFSVLPRALKEYVLAIRGQRPPGPMPGQMPDVSSGCIGEAAADDAI